MCFFVSMSMQAARITNNNPSENNFTYPAGGFTWDDLKNAYDLIYTFPDSAQEIAREYLSLSEREKDWTIDAYSILAHAHLFQSQYELSLKNHLQALMLALDIEDERRIGFAYHGIGTAYLSSGNYSKAYDYFIRAYDIYALLNDSMNVANIKMNIGIVFSKVMDIEKAFLYLYDVRDMFAKLNHEIGTSIVYNNLSNCYSLLGDYDSAIYYIDRAIEIGEKYQNTFYLVAYYFEKAELLMQLGAYRRAYDHYDKSIFSARKVNYLQGLANAKSGKAKVFLEEGFIDSAKQYINQSKEIAVSINNKQLEYHANLLLSKVYRKKGELEKAFEYHDLAINQKDSLALESQLRHIYNREIEELGRQTEEQRMTIRQQQVDIIKKRNTMVVSLLLAGSSIVFIAFGYYFHIFRRKQEQKNRIYEDRLLHSSQLTKAVIDAEAQERKRLGAELHDGVGPLISLLKLNISSLYLEPPLPKERKKAIIKTTEETIDEMLKEMKLISNNLTPFVLQEKGCFEAVAELARKIDQTTGYKVLLDIRGVNGSLDNYLEHTIYRSIQEILNNAITHADGTEINMQIIQNNEDLTIMIEDNGKGFDPKDVKTNGGIGLNSIAYRIQSLNGEFHIDSVIGRGSIITFIIPLEKTMHK